MVTLFGSAADRHAMILCLRQVSLNRKDETGKKIRERAKTLRWEKSLGGSLWQVRSRDGPEDVVIDVLEVMELNRGFCRW